MIVYRWLFILRRGPECQDDKSVVIIALEDFLRKYLGKDNTSKPDRTKSFFCKTQTS